MPTPPRRTPLPTRERLTRERVHQAALSLIDQQGPEALSMRRLGEALGVEAMSLYHHVPGRAALLDGIYEELLRGLEPPRRREFPHGLRELARSLRAALAAHPRALPLLATRPLVAPAALRHLDDALGQLRAAGLTPGECGHALHALLTFVTGHALAQTGASDGGPLGAVSRAASSAPASAASDFPNLAALAPQLLEKDAGPDTDADAGFEFGLDALLRGFAARATERAQKKRRAGRA